jgi:hypothetical protein
VNTGSLVNGRDTTETTVLFASAFSEITGMTGSFVSVEITGMIGSFEITGMTGSFISVEITGMTGSFVGVVLGLCTSGFSITGPFLGVSIVGHSASGSQTGALRGHCLVSSWSGEVPRAQGHPSFCCDHHVSSGSYVECLSLSVHSVVFDLVIAMTAVQSGQCHDFACKCCGAVLEQTAVNMTPIHS